MVAQPSAIAAKLPGRIFFPGRSASLSSQIIGDVRDALFAKKLKPGDGIGTENEIAARYGVSRIVARDALRTLEALGIAEIMDAQRAIECLAAELAAENASDEDIARLRQSIADAEASMGDVARFTQLGAEFHLAVAEASHNRVLVVQLISLQHVSWPRRNPTLTRKVMRRIQDVHKELLAFIEIRDAAGARRLMDDHVKMIRARRVSEHAKQSPLSFRGRPKARTRNPERGSELASGFRVRTFGASRNDGGDDETGCC